MAIQTSKANGILTIEFDRVDRKNAITSAMYQTMVDTINAAEAAAVVKDKTEMDALVAYLQVMGKALK